MMITMPASQDGCEHCDDFVCLAKSLPIWVPRKLGLRQRLPCEFFIVHVTPGSWMSCGGAVQGRKQALSRWLLLKVVVLSK